eukprot:86339_1
MKKSFRFDSLQKVCILWVVYRCWNDCKVLQTVMKYISRNFGIEINYSELVSGTRSKHQPQDAVFILISRIRMAKSHGHRMLTYFAEFVIENRSLSAKSSNIIHTGTHQPRFETSCALIVGREQKIDHFAQGLWTENTVYPLRGDLLIIFTDIQTDHETIVVLKRQQM